MIKARPRPAQRASRNIPQGFDATTASIPSPVKGWNAADSLADMDEAEAVVLTNWFPSTTEVMVRLGYDSSRTGLPGQVQSLLVHNGATASKMFAASGTAFYDVSTAGAVGAAVVTGLTNVKWQYVNFATSGGQYLMAVNGADKLRYYDGTNWDVDGGGFTITGLNTINAIHINVFKRRVWLVEKNSLSAWYLPIDSIQGAAVEFPLDPLADKGGYLMAMGTWTIDAGIGADDMAVFVTSEGQVIVYRGINPSNEVTWSLVGVFNVGSPFSRRCLTKMGGDLLLITYDGLFPLSQYLQSDRVNQKSALTDKIQNAVSEATSFYNANFGWETIVYPVGQMILLNIPFTEGANQQQYVMNALTGAWCNFTGWDANCWALYNDEIYFGSNTFVARAWSGYYDNVANIEAVAQQAFNYFGSRGQLKRWTMMRPVLSSTGAPGIQANVNVDFEQAIPTTTISFTAPTTSDWDVARWDSAIWGGAYTIYKYWQGVNGVGYCAGPVLQSETGGIDTRWLSTDFVMEAGGVI